MTIDANRLCGLNTLELDIHFQQLGIVAQMMASTDKLGTVSLVHTQMGTTHQIPGHVQPTIQSIGSVNPLTTRLDMAAISCGLEPVRPATTAEHTT